MLNYPECPKCEGRTVIKHIDGEGVWYTDCDLCEGYGDMRINVLPDLSDEDVHELNKGEYWAMQEVFGVN